MRNVRCVKCHKYGHINTDKECPMYGKAMDAEAPQGRLDQSRLIESMREDGMKMRFSAWDIENTRGKKYDLLKDGNGEQQKQEEANGHQQLEEPEDEVRKKSKLYCWFVLVVTGIKS